MKHHRVLMWPLVALPVIVRSAESPMVVQVVVVRPVEQMITVPSLVAATWVVESQQGIVLWTDHDRLATFQHTPHKLPPARVMWMTSSVSHPHNLHHPTWPLLRPIPTVFVTHSSPHNGI